MAQHFSSPKLKTPSLKSSPKCQKQLKEILAKILPLLFGGPMVVGSRFIFAFLACVFCLLVRGYLLCLEAQNEFEIIGVPELIVLLFLPSLLLALLATLDLRSWNSLKILLSHPSISLLPTFTFFTFSKISSGDRRVSFSYFYTWFNLAVSVALMVGYLGKTYQKTGELSISAGCLMAAPIFFTSLFLYLDKCCSLSPQLQWRVLDPDQQGKIFTMKEGKIVEEKEEYICTLETVIIDNIETKKYKIKTEQVDEPTKMALLEDDVVQE